MTYAQSKGHHNIDWSYFLDHPPQTNAGWKLAQKAALGYTQDPGGCLPVEIERGPGGEIKDTKLNELCRDFYWTIFHKNIGQAKYSLKLIIARSNELLKTQKLTA